MPPFRTTVKILDADGEELPQGETGVIHVGNDMPFGGYTDGNTKSFSDPMSLSVETTPEQAGPDSAAGVGL